MSEWDIKEKIPVPESNGNSHWIYSALLGRKAPHWNLAPVRWWTKDSKRVTLFWENEGERFSVLIYWEFNTVVKESIDVSLATSSYHSGYSFSGFWEEFRPKKKKKRWLRRWETPLTCFILYWFFVPSRVLRTKTQYIPDVEGID